MLLPLVILSTVILAQRASFGFISKDRLLLILNLVIAGVYYQIAVMEWPFLQWDILPWARYALIGVPVVVAFLIHGLAFKLSEKSKQHEFFYAALMTIGIALTTKIIINFRLGVVYENQITAGVFFALLPVVLVALAIGSAFGGLYLIQKIDLSRYAKMAAFTAIVALIAFVLNEILILLSNSIYWWRLDGTSENTAITLALLALIGYLIVNEWLKFESDRLLANSLFVGAVIVAIDFQSLLTSYGIAQGLKAIFFLAVAIAIPALYIYIAILTSLAAERKGRNRQSWFWLCLLSPVISWFAIASMLPPQNKTTE